MRVSVSPSAPAGPRSRSLDHFIRPRQQRGRGGEVKGFGGLEIDDEVELVDLLDREVPGVGTEKDAVDMLGREPAQSEAVLTIARQRSLGDVALVREHRRELLRPRGVQEQLLLADDHRVRRVDEGIGLAGPERVQARPQRLDGGDRPLDELDLEPTGRIARDSHGDLSGRVVGAVEDHDPAKLRHHLPQELEALRRELREPAVDTSEPASGLAEALDEADGHGVGASVEDDRNALRGPLGGERHRGRDRVDQVDLLLLESPRRRLHQGKVALGVMQVEHEMLALHEPELLETVPQPVDVGEVRAALEDDADAIHPPSLLGLGGERRGEEPTREHTHERPALHYSITWSARANSEGGMVRLRALAVLRLMTSSNLTGA